MRANAHFDAEAEQQLTYLADVTGMGVSKVQRTSVQHYDDLVRARRGGPGNAPSAGHESQTPWPSVGQDGA